MWLIFLVLCRTFICIHFNHVFFHTKGLVGVANAGPECFVVAIATNKNTEMGLLKSRLMALAGYVRESLTLLTTTQQQL